MIRRASVYAAHQWLLTYYNFCRVHQTLRVAPAMDAGLMVHVGTVEELVKLMEPKSIQDGLTEVA